MNLPKTADIYSSLNKYAAFTYVNLYAGAAKVTTYSALLVPYAALRTKVVPVFYSLGII